MQCKAGKSRQRNFQHFHAMQLQARDIQAKQYQARQFQIRQLQEIPGNGTKITNISGNNRQENFSQGIPGNSSQGNSSQDNLRLFHARKF